MVSGYIDTPMTREQQELVEQNYMLAHKFASKFNKYGLDHEDVVQSICLAFCMAVKKYDPGKGKFSTFTTRPALGAVTKLYARENKHGDTILDNEETHYEPSVDSTTHSDTEHNDLKRIILNSLDELGEERKHIMIELYGLNTGVPRTLTDIAKELKTKYQNVRYHKPECLEALKQYEQLEEYYGG